VLIPRLLSRPAVVLQAQQAADDADKEKENFKAALDTVVDGVHSERRMARANAASATLEVSRCIFFIMLRLTRARKSAEMSACTCTQQGFAALQLCHIASASA